MKRIASLVAFLSIWVSSPTLFAQESIENELELVRQLRAKGKGWNDLVKAKIEELLKRNDPNLNAALPLELARVNIDAARQLDPEQRFVLFTAARSQLEDYIKKNQGKLGAALASVELARLTSYHGQALLSKAMREEDNQSRHEKARPAELMFIQAGKDLEAAVKLLESAAKDPKNSAMKKTLERELQQARFDTATNYFDQARTYIDKGKEAVNAQRSLTIDKAKKLFLELSKDESAEVGYLANAWYMKCSIEHNDPPNAQKYYSYVMKKKDDPAAKAAVRLATYFYIQDITLPRPDDVETIGSNIVVPKNPKSKVVVTPIDQLHKVEKECEAWLKTYGVKKNYESEGVLFELGHAYLVEASILANAKDEKTKKPLVKDDKAKAALYKKAEEKFDELAKLDGDNSERARQISASIKRMTLSPTGKLTSFSDYLMRAMLERDKVRELSNKLDDAKNPEAAKKVEDERKKKLKDVINALNEGLTLTTPADPPSKVDDARYYLCGAYLTYGDPYRAAIIGEALGRHRPATKRSPEGAATAIATYASLQSRHPDDAVLRDRLKDLATFVLAPENKAWSADPVASLAHYHLAMLDKKDNKLKSAVQHLEQIAPTFTDYIYTQGQLVFIAEDARLNTTDPKEQQWYTTAAKAAIGRMPKFNLKDDSPSVITMYFFAKIEMSKFLYSEAYDQMVLPEGKLKAVAKCNEMTKLLKDLQAELATVAPGRITEKSHSQIDFTLRVMLKYADLGIAETKFRSGENDLVLKATESVVTEMLAEAKKTPTGESIVKKDNAVIGKILGLALRANVQKGDVAKGKAILDVLQRLKGEGGNDAGTGNVVSELLRDIAGQIKIMVDAKDPALAKTKDNYVGFLDVIAKETKVFDNNTSTMLGHAYVSLQVPAKAAAIFAKVQPPAALEKKIVIPKNETPEQKEARGKVEEEFARYWAIQIEYIRALRGSKEKESMKTAESIINTILKHPNGRFQIQAMMEKNHLLEEQEKYREAYAGWQAIMKMPSIEGRRADKDVAKIYFTCYFQASRTLYLVATLDKKLPDKDRPKYITSAANMMVKLEYTKGKEGFQIVEWTFNEFLKEKESYKYKLEYDRLKALQEKTSSLTRPDSGFAATFEAMMMASRERKRAERAAGNLQSLTLPARQLVNGQRTHS